MNAISLADAPALRPAAHRLTAVRVALASIAIGAALAAFLSARHPGTRTLVPLASRGDTIVVVDLSASISTDTYAQIGATLSTLARSGARLGLVLFSDQAYEAMPQGTPARDLLPLARLFVVPRQARPGFVPTIPPNPWTASFSGGTKISAGLTLAHTLAVAARGRPSHVVLVSDLSDDPGDLARLGSILLAYRRDHVPVRIVGLNPSDADLAFFRHALSPAPTVVSAPPSSAAAPAARTAFPWLLVLTALLACAALALHEGWAPRLEWSEA
ncbi:MAG TPA: vWA domain-containing protein [Gaiellaceae bacterium]|nr:vWA domain-containing protein [Gaiellaceae bacterium]